MGREGAMAVGKEAVVKVATGEATVAMAWVGVTVTWVAARAATD